MKRTLFAALFLLPLLAWAQGPAPAANAASAPEVLMKTSEGDITIQLFPDKAPKTVANFLRYVQDGFYAGTVFHRSIKGFLLQGGIYDRELTERRTRPAIPDEANNGLSNLRGTLAAARNRDVPDSATSQFFINLVDNRRLDYVSDRDGLTWGYAVFGKVTTGMEVVDKIAALPTRALGPFTGDVPKPLVVIESVTVINAAPAASASTAKSVKASAAKPAVKSKSPTEP